MRARPAAPIPPTPPAVAADLRYVGDGEPGIERRRNGDGFAYYAPDGRRVRDKATLARIASLAIPPVYADVWICPDPCGHIQATGRDARGRKQYRYHPRWRAARDGQKYDRMVAFAQALPRIRERADADLARPGLPREKVLAAVVRLLEASRIRVGNEEYRRQNGSFGLTTLRDRHVEVIGSSIRFEFRGKSGKRHRVRVTDRRLARVVKRCQEIPGQDLFQYIDADGERHSIGSADVNAYLRATSDAEFTAKDFRTWAGTLLAARHLRLALPPASDADGRRTVAQAIAAVAEELGNTPTVCRNCYVHPAVIAAYLDGSIQELAEPPDGNHRVASPYRLSAEERALLALLTDAVTGPSTDSAGGLAGRLTS
jgi:DNA topoisomerase-1